MACQNILMNASSKGRFRHKWYLLSARNNTIRITLTPYNYMSYQGSPD